MSKKPIPEVITQLVSSRKTAKLTQAKVAINMNTTPSAVARLESGGGKAGHSPRWATLESYANAIGVDIKTMIVNRVVVE